jgi:hypothetical protein
MQRSLIVAVSMVCVGVGIFIGYSLALYLQNNALLLAGIAIALAAVTWIGSGTDIMGLLRDMYRESQEEKRKPTLAFGDISVQKRVLESGKTYNQDTYSIRVSIATGEGIVDDCHLYLDIKGTPIRHFPTVWTDSAIRYMPISEFEDAKLFTMSDYYGKKELIFSSQSLNPTEYPPRSKNVSLEEIIDKDMIITLRVRNGNIPKPLTMTIKQILAEAEKNQITL